MMKRKCQKPALVSFLLALSVLTTGCLHEGFQSVQNGLSGGQGHSGPIVPDSSPVDMSKLDAELDQMELEVSRLEKEVEGLDILRFSQSSGGSQESLNKEMRKLFEKLLVAVGRVKAQKDELKQKVRDRLAKLDPTNPLHVPVILRVQEALQYLDRIDGFLAEAVSSIVEKLDQVVARLDRKVAELDPKNPLTWIVMANWEQVKIVILEYRAKLLAEV
jgi:hypothetical protein